MHRPGLATLDSSAQDSPAHVLAQWSAAVEAKDPDAIAALYHPDCQVLGFAVRLRGSAALRDELAAPLLLLGQVKVRQGTRLAQGPDSLLVELTVESRLGRMRATHGFVVRAGRIAHHFIGNVHRDAGTHATA
jgi:hypothetical protein